MDGFVERHLRKGINDILLRLLLLQAGIVNPSRAVWGGGIRPSKMGYKAVRDCFLESYRGKQNIGTYLIGKSL